MERAPDVLITDLLRREGGPERANEPDQQVEIQLGHLCNNRCVFCVSGQRTARGQAGVSPIEPILTHIRDARARGHDKITLLGGEPTLQPGFLRILKECADLGFSEVVVFTNGAKTASGKLIDEALATGANIAFRISIQGASERTHERTTLKDGSFGRIVRTLSELRARGLKTTVNMCLVASNHEDLEQFAPLLLPFGVQQLHVDLMRPLDAGDRSEAELQSTLAPLDQIGSSLTRMVEAFPEDFDVNVGNLPYCLAPTIAERIHHDGQATETIAIDGGDSLSAPWDKYATKRRDKVKPARCSTCVFDAQCTGIYEDYLRLQGDAALVPVTEADLARIDPEQRWTSLATASLAKRLEKSASVELHREGLGAVRITVQRNDARAEVRLVPPSTPSLFRYRGFSVEVLRSAEEPTAWLAEQLASEQPIAPVTHSASLPRPLASALRRLLQAAPFEGLAWQKSECDEREVVLHFDAAPGRVALTLGLDGAGKVSMRYALFELSQESQLRAAKGLRAVMATLSRPSA